MWRLWVIDGMERERIGCCGNDFFLFFFWYGIVMIYEHSV
jgi:hypothetical protein